MAGAAAAADVGPGGEEGGPVSGFRRLNWTESYDGTLRQSLPANGTVAAYTAGANGLYNRGLQVESSWHIRSSIGRPRTT